VFRSEKGQRIMMYRLLPLSLVALALALFVGASALADDAKAADAGKTHDGTVIRVTAEKLVMKDIAKNGVEAKEMTYRLADNAVVTCDGKKCKLEDLKADQKIRVTNQKGDNETIVKVEALNKNEKFEKRDDKDNDKK
jgi:hypothetical protein